MSVALAKAAGGAQFAEYRALKAVVSHLSPQARKAMVEALEKVRSETDLRAIEKALTRGDVASAMSKIPLSTFEREVQKEMAVYYERAIASGADASMGFMPSTVKATMRFDVTNPRAEAWAYTRSSNLVTAITAEQRDTIRLLIGESFTRNIPPFDIARRIREVVGLNGPQAKALANYRAMLEAEGYSDAQIAKLVEKYRKRLVAYRADMIARTEILSASNFGQQELWLQARDLNLLPTKAKRAWIVTPDEKLCPLICRPMNGQQVGLQQPFVTGKGASVMAPPAHPQCRCTMGLVLDPKDTAAHKLPPLKPVKPSRGLKPKPPKKKPPKKPKPPRKTPPPSSSPPPAPKLPYNPTAFERAWARVTPDARKWFEEFVAKSQTFDFQALKRGRHYVAEFQDARRLYRQATVEQEWKAKFPTRDYDRATRTYEGNWELWSGSSNSEGSALLKAAAEKEFGVSTGYHNGITQGDVGAPRWARIIEEAEDRRGMTVDQVRPLLRADYEFTQALYAENGVSSVKLHRGVTEGYFVNNGIPVPSVGDVGETTMNSLSSWTNSSRLANDWADVALEAETPVADIVLDFASTTNLDSHFSETEFVVMGRPKRFSITKGRPRQVTKAKKPALKIALDTTAEDSDWLNDAKRRGLAR